MSIVLLAIVNSFKLAVVRGIIVFLALWSPALNEPKRIAGLEKVHAIALTLFNRILISVEGRKKEIAFN